ncbi:MAG: SDR family NAD(P)-dependent oxidoreductase [Lachnospiraceae bacterium]|jgi:NAD(P)-dependent dehydrogenase (short-subunit alcohol dehydrogenase family)
MKNRFEKKIVVITGAAGGIGKATTKLFAAEGATVVLVGRNIEKLNALVKELKLKENAYLVCGCDVSEEKEVADMISGVVTRFGKIDVFFNNAGIIGSVAKTQNYSVDSLTEALNINVVGTFNGMKHALLIMQQQRSGVIINSCSIASFRGNPDTIGYVASKHAIWGMTRAVAVENAHLGIRVCAVAPSPVDTPMMSYVEDGMVEMGNGDKQTVHKQLSSLPMGRYATPEEVAKAVLFLASEDASFTTGSALFVDGGFMA